MKTNRRDFARQLLLGSSVLAFAPATFSAQEPKRPAPYDREIVQKFVIAGHNNLEKVKTMLVDYPNLLSSTWDWGNGDFEMAIEGAGHVGNKDIANYLIGAGARVNIFVLTMLGKTKIVKPILEEYPKLIFAKGAHGFTLLHHAKKGGENAVELHDYLQSKGLTETKMSLSG